MIKAKTYTLITGASGGIGSALAREFAGHGHNLVLHGRTLDSLGQVVADCRKAGVAVETILGDLSLPGAAVKLHDELVVRKITVSQLVNNAGYGDFGFFEDTDIVKTHGLMMVNMVALTELTRLFLPQIIKARGGVLNVASVVGFFPGPLMAVYYASKAYVLSFSNALSNELEGRARVTALCPGITKTGFVNAAHLQSSKLSKGGMMSAEKVAQLGYRGFMAGKPIVVTGLRNRINVLLHRLMPRMVSAKIIRGIQEKA